MRCAEKGMCGRYMVGKPTPGRFDTQSKFVLDVARRMADAEGHKYVSLRHISLALRRCHPSGGTQ